MLASDNLLMTSIKSILNVKNIVGSEICVSCDDGEKVYQYIMNLKNKRESQRIHSDLPIDIDFEGITTLTAAFLNTAIGQLYDRPIIKFTNKYINYIGLSDDDKFYLDRVIANAKIYYDNPKRWVETIKQVLDEFE